MKKVKEYFVSGNASIDVWIPYGDRDTCFVLNFSGDGLEYIEYIDADGECCRFHVNDKDDLEVAVCIHNWLNKNLPIQKEIKY